MHKFLFSFLLTITTLGVNAQSFNNEKTSAVNFVKRVYNSAPFEGIKKLEGEERNYYAVAVVLMNIPKDSVLRYCKI